MLLLSHCLDNTVQSSAGEDLVSKLSVVEKLLDTLQNAKENKVIDLLAYIIIDKWFFVILALFGKKIKNNVCVNFMA